MKKPQIRVNSDRITKIWGYSFKECVDYLKFKYNINVQIYNDLISWGDPFLIEYPTYFIEKVTEEIQNPYEYIVNEILNDLYSTEELEYKDEFVDVIEIFFIEFGIACTIENLPVVGFLNF